MTNDQQKVAYLSNYYIFYKQLIQHIKNYKNIKILKNNLE